MTDRIATIRLDRPERKNPLTFESYAELRDTFRALPYADDVDVVVFASNGGNFCSGGDVHDIIGPLVGRDMKDLLAFTRMTGDLVKAMLACGKPIIAAVDGICVGAGAIVAMASDLRLATPEAKTRLPLHPRRPRRLRHGRLRDAAPHHRPGPRRRAALHRPHDDRRRRRALGLLQRDLVAADALEAEAMALAAPARRRPDLRPRHDQDAADPGMEHGPRAGDRGRGAGAGDLHADQDFDRAYHAFVAKEKPVFEGN